MTDNDAYLHHTVAFHTLGCKLNFSETSDMSRRMTNAGFERVDFDQYADIYVINTCTVTEEANKKCRQIINRCKRHNPDAFIVVTGCYAQLQSERVAQIEGVALVLGANKKDQILQSVQEGLANRQQKRIVSSDILRDKNFVPSYSSGDRTRSFLKVQDGCDYFCSYCTIPMARGLSRSATVEQTLEMARRAAADGAKEIVLTGVNIGDFGRHQGENLLQLIQRLEEVQGIERFRISSIEPNLLTDDIIRHSAASHKFMPHFHIPLQSGSDTMLRLMRRRYDTNLYAQKINTIKKLIPHAFIGVDVIVGVNGETTELFEQTRSFIDSLDVTQLHVFTYSERPGTKALDIKPVVPVAQRHDRNAILHEISERKRLAFYQAHQGKLAKVLIESSVRDGLHVGFTENYIRVELPADTREVNTIATVRLGNLTADKLALVGTRLE
ncbi:MAG: tRNA (N(6)-L-threonylcarbamoyladenosine(37)-C(2))-methylthiotransferase MtaB [Bacteroidales bacterium]|nr:tRNA (N(6)-L-threonylcarbamoyladenosine(37)-C(2))-methylthiotransferase MtaB [Bacteroidales bacterium]